MKRFVVVAAALAALAALVCGRSYLATAQQPQTAVPPASQGTYRSSAVPTAEPPAARATASLAELVEQLKAVRQQKAEIQREEERITAAIRLKIEEEKKLHEKIEQLLDNAADDSLKSRS